MLTGDGKLRLETPRDQEGSFEPVFLPKYARRVTPFSSASWRRVGTRFWMKLFNDLKTGGVMTS